MSAITLNSKFQIRNSCVCATWHSVEVRIVGFAVSEEEQHMNNASITDGIQTFIIHISCLLYVHTLDYYLHYHVVVLYPSFSCSFDTTNVDNRLLQLYRR